MPLDRQDLQNMRSVKATMDPFKPEDSQITFFKVAAVNALSRTIDIEYMHSSIKEKNVSYMSPFLNSKSGIDFVPEVGDVGLVARTAANGRFVIGFLSGKNRSEGLPLGPGDILTKTGLMAITKQDSDGNILLVTETGASVILSKEGVLTTIASSEEYLSDAREAVSERNGNFIASTESFFEDGLDAHQAITSPIIEALIDDIMRTGDIPMQTLRRPVFRIHTVNKLKDGVPEVLEVGFDGSDVAVVHEMEVVDKITGDKLSSITFDRHGNIFIKARNLIYDVDDIQMR